MEKFARLLIETDKPIADLAMEIGIGNQKNLSRQFKALKDISPAEYRKQYRLTQENKF